MRTLLTITALALLGCATTSPEREACYVKAHAALWEAAELRCGPTGDDWKRCPVREQLLAEHRIAQRNCP